MNRIEAVVAGHICLDVIPDLAHLPAGQLAKLLQPGHLVTAGEAVFSTGGPVSNTGLALHRLGISTRLAGKIGADPFGSIVRHLVGNYDPDLAKGLLLDPYAPTSYSIILSAPGVDRIFLHCPGANDSFGSADVSRNLYAKPRLFHFGYPPLMRRMYTRQGEELAEIFRKVKAAGVTTSLDMSFPDPASESGQVDWNAILAKTLPFVDLFMPSFEEILFCLKRGLYEDLLQRTQGHLLEAASPELVSELGELLLALGSKMAVIKLGDRGLYLRCCSLERMESMGRAAPANPAEWAGCEVRVSCFQVDVVGTTGSGDATIAGFLSALLRGFGPLEAANAAVGVGACNVEAPDALSGLRSWDDTLARIQSGWTHAPLEIHAPGWQCVTDGIWRKKN
jgi:sugar/nucleoside kinase (ribokinase family)